MTFTTPHGWRQSQPRPAICWCPPAYQQQHDGSWDEIDTSGPGLGLAYSPTTLVTEIDADDRAISSSTKPDLMVRMLETLDVHDGHRVLEIGTGYLPRPVPDCRGAAASRGPPVTMTSEQAWSGHRAQAGQAFAVPVRGYD